jgi:hypothetical protein
MLTTFFYNNLHSEVGTLPWEEIQIRQVKRQKISKIEDYLWLDPVFLPDALFGSVALCFVLDGMQKVFYSMLVQPSK